nr:ATP-binding protein [Treponema sp.]
MIVGRKEEIKLLRGIAKDDRSHFVAVYGRRRVGKTFLIRESYDYDFTFQHAGLSAGGLKDQLFAFCSSLKDSGYSFKRKPENWLEAFEGVKDVIRKSQTEKKLSLLMSFHGWTLQSVI